MLGNGDRTLKNKNIHPVTDRTFSAAVGVFKTKTELNLIVTSIDRSVV